MFVPNNAEYIKSNSILNAGFAYLSVFFSLSFIFSIILFLSSFLFSVIFLFPFLIEELFLIPFYFLGLVQKILILNFLSHYYYILLLKEYFL